MKVKDMTFFKKYIAMASYGDALGWHERNGGNFTYWIREKEWEAIQEELYYGKEWIPIGVSVKELAKEHFLISGAGKYFHNMKDDPEDCIGIININEDGDKYRICWGFINGGYPTSELSTHLMNMEVKKKQSNANIRVLYHCHCPNVIALTFLLPIDSVVLTRELWEMMSECAIVFPEGIGIVDWMVPGGTQIAIATSKLMESFHAVIWAHHGIFCCGVDFDTTFGLMHTIEKSAEIWIKVHSCGHKRQAIPVEGWNGLAKQFGVTLEEKYLYKK